MDWLAELPAVVRIHVEGDGEGAEHEERWRLRVAAVHPARNRSRRTGGARTSSGFSRGRLAGSGWGGVPASAGASWIVGDGVVAPASRRKGPIGAEGITGGRRNGF